MDGADRQSYCVAGGGSYCCHQLKEGTWWHYCNAKCVTARSYPITVLLFSGALVLNTHLNAVPMHVFHCISNLVMVTSNICHGRYCFTLPK